MLPESGNWHLYPTAYCAYVTTQITACRTSEDNKSSEICIGSIRYITRTSSDHQLLLKYKQFGLHSLSSLSIHASSLVVQIAFTRTGCFKD